MGLHLLVTDDLNSEDIVCQIAEKISGNQYLHLCATQTIKEIRLEESVLSEAQICYTSGRSVFNLATTAEFGGYLQKEALTNSEYIRISDERYIFTRIIDAFFNDATKRTVFHSMRFQLHELYQFLLFHDISVSNSVIKKIGSKYSEFERDVFALYSLFARSIDAIEKGETDDEITAILDSVDIGSRRYVAVRELIKRMLSGFIDSLDVIVFDGFLFFNDLQRVLLEYAIAQNKDVYLTVKYTNGPNYLFDTVYPSLFRDLNQEYIRPLVEKKAVKSATALQFVRSAYGDFSLEPPDAELLRDGSIQFVKPFPNREMEWQYIAEQISRVLCENSGKDIEKLQSMLKDDIAIALAHKGFSEQLSAILKDVGLFVFGGYNTLNNPYISGTVAKTFDNVYFRRADFMSEDIRREDGSPLTYAEKTIFFDHAFKGIKIRKSKPSIIAYPVGQYVFKIYDILLNGISVNTFKILLYSNWQYNVQSNAVKWDKYLSDFKMLEVFFEGKTKVDEWIATVQTMLELKDSVDADYLLRYHPVKAVSKGSLEFILDILRLINELVVTIGSVNGSIAEHLRVLKHTVMRVDAAIFLEDTQFERSIVIELLDAVDSISASPLIKSVPASYFAENLYAMLADFESAAEDNEETDDLFLNVVILENVKHFKYCFYPLFEADKYPRKYVEGFPLSREIIEILKNPEFGINRLPSDYKELPAHITLEENLFQNVLGFARERLVITMTQKEDERKNYISHYAHDIASLFDSDIVWTEACGENNLASMFSADRKLPALRLPKKDSYTLKELATYKLCPRLYFHDEQGETAYNSKFHLQFYFVAVLFSATLNEFKVFNLSNKKVYSTSGDEAFKIAEMLFNAMFDSYLPLFNIFTDYELSDIRNTVERKIRNFFADLNEKGIKGNMFTVVGVPESLVHRGSDYDLILEYDTKIYDMEQKTSRISQNDMFLDFLVLKTSDDEKEPLKHYADMLEALAQNKSNCDRVNLAFKIIGKINIQFDSKRFADDGIARTNALVDEIRRANFSFAKPYVSGFCQYCRVNDVCKERAVSK